MKAGVYTKGNKELMQVTSAKVKKVKAIYKKTKKSARKKMKALETY